MIISSFCYWLKFPSHRILIKMFRWAKAVRYFGNEMNDLVAQQAFSKVVGIINYTGVCDTVPAWYSLSRTSWIWFYGLENSFENHSFMFTWRHLIFEVLTNQTKLFESSDYFPGINCSITFRVTKDFGCFCYF